MCWPSFFRDTNSCKFSIKYLANVQLLRYFVRISYRDRRQIRRHFEQCFGSVLNSIRIRIQHFRSIRIRIRLRIQVFSGQNERIVFLRKIKILFSVTNCYKDNNWGLPSSSKTHQTFCKMVKAIFTLKSLFYFPFWTPFWLSWIRIRIPNTDPDPDPHGYGSGPGSGPGSETLILSNRLDWEQYKVYLRL